MIPRRMPEFHVGDYGTVIEFQFRRSNKEPLDISEAFAIEIVFMRPDGTSFSRPMQLLTSEESSLSAGSDGIAFYVVQSGDWDVAGNWFLQGYVEFDSGAWNSSVVHVIIFPNLINVSDEVLVP